MKRTVTIGTLIGVGCLLAAPLRAQEDQPVRYRSTRPQVAPGTPGPIRPRFQNSRDMGDRTRVLVPERTAAPPISNVRAPSTPTNTPPRPKTKKSHAKPHLPPQEKNNDSAPGTAATRTERHATSERHESERTTSTPVRTPPAPVPVPNPAHAPVVSPVVSPPVATPRERAAQMPGQPATQQVPSRLQRPTLNDLSEDERARLHSAHQNAFQHDPNLAASRARYLNARKEFRQKLQDALLKADPSVQPILEKIRRDKPEEHD